MKKRSQTKEEEKRSDNYSKKLINLINEVKENEKDPRHLLTILKSLASLFIYRNLNIESHLKDIDTLLLFDEFSIDFKNMLTNFKNEGLV